MVHAFIHWHPFVGGGSSFGINRTHCGEWAGFFHYQSKVLVSKLQLELNKKQLSCFSAIDLPPLQLLSSVATFGQLISAGRKQTVWSSRPPGPPQLPLVSDWPWGTVAAVARRIKISSWEGFIIHATLTSSNWQFPLWSSCLMWQISELSILSLTPGIHYKTGLRNPQQLPIWALVWNYTFGGQEYPKWSATFFS